MFLFKKISSAHLRSSLALSSISCSFSKNRGHLLEFLHSIDLKRVKNNRDQIKRKYFTKSLTSVHAQRETTRAEKKKRVKGCTPATLKYTIRIDIILFFSQFSISIRFIVAKYFLVARQWVVPSTASGSRISVSLCSITTIGLSLTFGALVRKLNSRMYSPSFKI